MVLVVDLVTWDRGTGLFLGQADLPCSAGPRESRSDPLPDLPAQEALSVWGLVDGRGPLSFAGWVPLSAIRLPPVAV